LIRDDKKWGGPFDESEAIGFFSRWIPHFLRGVNRTQRKYRGKDKISNPRIDSGPPLEKRGRGSLKKKTRFPGRGARRCFSCVDGQMYS